VLRQARREARVFRASLNRINLILSLSKDEAAASAAGNLQAMIDFFTTSKAGAHRAGVMAAAGLFLLTGVLMIRTV
jgi:hypothetical protein